MVWGGEVPRGVPCVHDPVLLVCARAEGHEDEDVHEEVHEGENAHEVDHDAEVRVADDEDEDGEDDASSAKNVHCTPKRSMLSSLPQ